MNLAQAIRLFCYGTTEGAEKGWEHRQRAGSNVEEKLSSVLKRSGISKIPDVAVTKEGKQWRVTLPARLAGKVRDLASLITRNKWAVAYSIGQSSLMLRPRSPYMAATTSGQATTAEVDDEETKELLREKQDKLDRTRRRVAPYPEDKSSILGAQMNLANTVRLHGFGTSEGAKKGWESRGGGRHEDYANFQTAGRSTTMNGIVQNTHYLAPSQYKLDVKDDHAAGYSRVRETDYSNKSKVVHEGTPESARSFLSERYGIDHKRVPSMGTRL